MKRLLYKFILSFACLISGHIGCKKFVEVDPPVTSFNSGLVFKTDATAISVLNSIYAKLGSSGGSFWQRGAEVFHY